MKNRLWARNLNTTYAYNTADELMRETNALNGVTSYAQAFDGSEQTVVTTSFPDNGQRVETRYQGGSLKSLTGSAAFPAYFHYGTYNNDTWTKETKGSVSGTESVKSYADLLGRSWKTEYPDGAATVALAEKFSAADTILNKCLDKLVYQFKDSAPDFFNEYQSARPIVTFAAGARGMRRPRRRRRRNRRKASGRAGQSAARRWDIARLFQSPAYTKSHKTPTQHMTLSSRSCRRRGFRNPDQPTTRQGRRRRLGKRKQTRLI